MKELKIEQWPVERLRPYGRELKVTDKALPQMVDALRQWGFRIPLLVTGDGEIVDGKTRYRAALELRMETVPVIVADDLTPTQVRTFPAVGQPQRDVGGLERRSPARGNGRAAAGAGRSAG